MASIASAGLILVILLVLAVYDAKMVNRISLRLTAVIALVDIVNHLNNMAHWTLGEGDFCVASAFLRFFGRQVYCFLNISIALNLHLILLLELRPEPSWEKYYWIFSFVVPLAMNLPPLALGMFGFNGERCFVRHAAGYKILLAINLPLVMLITFVYCSLISVLVMIRLRAKLTIVRNLSPDDSISDQSIQRKVEVSLKRLIFRISLYPVTCVISMSFYFFANVWNIAIYNNTTLLAFAMLGLTLTGILNLIAFLLDPTLQAAAAAMSKSLKERFTRDYSLAGTTSQFILITRFPYPPRPRPPPRD
ncbi:hypothetical protein DSO57_1032599 [Entomophthora muscae]|uniref:Uncharacterized protein n=1 Tax=Entomophthora muscae TaxID=34485 RepID=A0ACC2UAH5_9FUNG|nr:hypothetical protein DSO57_1032599 [Entomophthora muscae]